MAGSGSTFSVGASTDFSNEGLIQVGNGDKLLVQFNDYGPSGFSSTGTIALVSRGTVEVVFAQSSLGTIQFTTGTAETLILDYPGHPRHRQHPELLHWRRDRVRRQPVHHLRHVVQHRNDHRDHLGRRHAPDRRSNDRARPRAGARHRHGSRHRRHRDPDRGREHADLDRRNGIGRRDGGELAGRRERVPRRRRRAAIHRGRRRTDRHRERSLAVVPGTEQLDSNGFARRVWSGDRRGGRGQLWRPDRWRQRRLTQRLVHHRRRRHRRAFHRLRRHRHHLWPLRRHRQHGRRERFVRGHRRHRVQLAALRRADRGRRWRRPVKPVAGRGGKRREFSSKATRPPASARYPSSAPLRYSI